MRYVSPPRAIISKLGAMISFDHITKHYPGSAQPALDRITLEVERGETLVLLGGSGSGKTTLLRLVNRLIEPDHGTVRVEGRDIAELGPVALRRRCGYVLQEAGLLPHLTVADNITLLLKITGETDAASRARADELLRLVQLDPAEFALRFPRQLSGGQQQRVNVARALALDPPILLLDEPFGALDEITRGQLQAAFRDLQSRLRKTVLFVTHDLFEAIVLADRIAVLAHGKVEQIGSPAELLRSPATEYVRDLFARPVRLLEEAARRRTGGAA